MRAWRRGARRHGLAYQPLTSTWRVGFGGFNQSFQTLGEALTVVSRSTRWKVAELSQLDADSRHYLEFSYRLDSSSCRARCNWAWAPRPTGCWASSAPCASNEPSLARAATFVNRNARWVWVVSAVAVVGAALVLAFVISLTGQSEGFYERNFIWLFWLNVAVAGVLFVVIGIAVVR